jgi:hypothetical protein
MPTNRNAAVSLRRGDQSPVTNLLSSFGGLKETHLSAMLGYLMHLNPGIARRLFEISDVIESVYLEKQSTDGHDRYDIILRHARREHVIEVKIGTHSKEQLNRYRKKHSHLYTIGNKLGVHRPADINRKNFRDWHQVSDALLKSRSLGRSADIYFNRLVDEFIKHLTENHMVQGSFNDVYVRDLSGESVGVYFNQWFYKCQPKFFESAKNSRYFAPYLTGSNSHGARKSEFHYALGTGISYISRIKSAVIATEMEAYTLLKDNNYKRDDLNAIFDSFNWRKTGKKDHAIFILDEPMRMVQRPITKLDIWGRATGAMPSISLDFGVLLSAANGNFPLKKKKK